MLKKEDVTGSGKALVKKNAPYPDRDIAITEQVYRAAFMTALGYTPVDVAKELGTTRQTIANYRQNKKFQTLVRDLDAAGDFEPSLEMRLLLRQTMQAATEAIEVLKSQFSATLITADGHDTGLPQSKIQQDAAVKMLEHLGRMVGAQAKAAGGGSDGDQVVIVNVNPMAGVDTSKIIDLDVKEVTDG